MKEDSFSKRVLQWFERHGRKDLPWQQDPTPYRVWVSEIMLQQTRVSSVIPYYERFMRQFPEILLLADASEDEVLHLWSGLGYYSRARNLHRAAQQIRDEFGGRFPEEPEAIQSLPGIGRSTAGAILSLAMGRCFPILDGNVKRVLARCFAVEGWPGKGAVQKELWRLAEDRLPDGHCREYNQALMDLGATLCSRTKPQCGVCPLGGLCKAHQQGTPEAYPAPKPRKPLPERAVQLLIIQNPEGELLLEKRPSAGVWGGLWSLPECPLEQEPLAWSSEYLDVAGAQANVWPTFRHTFSHFHLDIQPVEIRLRREQLRVMEGDRWVWYKITDPDARGFAAPVTRIISQLQQRGEEP